MKLHLVKHSIPSISIRTGATVAFVQESYTTAETSGAVSVCASITSGVLERSVSVTFSDANQGTANGESKLISTKSKLSSFHMRKKIPDVQI